MARHIVGELTYRAFQPVVVGHEQARTSARFEMSVKMGGPIKMLPVMCFYIIYKNSVRGFSLANIKTQHEIAHSQLLSRDPA